MADDLNESEGALPQYPFEMPSEEDVKFSDGAIEGRPAGVPSSYDEGGSTRWTPEAISEVHALAQLGRYQVRGYNTFNKRMPTFDDLTFVPATMTRLPLEGYRESCDTTTVLGAGARARGASAGTEDPDLHRVHVLRRAVGPAPRRRSAMAPRRSAP